MHESDVPKRGLYRDLRARPGAMWWNEQFDAPVMRPVGGVHRQLEPLSVRVQRRRVHRRVFSRIHALRWSELGYVADVRRNRTMDGDAEYRGLRRDNPSLQHDDASLYPVQFGRSTMRSLEHQHAADMRQ